MNTSLFICKTYHRRFRPKKHTLSFSYFMFTLDLNEVENSKLPWFISIENFNLFSFYREDHFRIEEKSTKESIEQWLKHNNFTGFKLKKFMLYTNLRFLGYQFNPVSFFICVDELDKTFVVAEVHNTFNEYKLYGLSLDNDLTGTVSCEKNFYISPFISEKGQLKISVQLSGPAGSKDHFKVWSYENNDLTLYADLAGKNIKLNFFNLLIALGKAPFVTLQIITRIHWHALLLFLKKIPYHRKATQFSKLEEEHVF